VPVPEGRLVRADEAAAFADKLGYPVVVKAVSSQLAHKTESGAVVLDLAGPEEVDAAVRQLSARVERPTDASFLVERMATGVVAELIIGVRRDRQFGLAMTLGAGGVLVELLHDTVTLLLPTTPEQIRAALLSLRVARLLDGYRGRPCGDVEAVVDAATAVAAYAADRADRLEELDVNPLLVRPAGCGVLAVDVLIRIAGDDIG
jgi:acetyl-CoA synthetase